MELRNARLSRVIKSQSTEEKIDKAPHREHDEEADETPHEKGSPFLRLLGVPRTLNEVVIDTNQKGYERDGEDKRNEDPVYPADNREEEVRDR